jgi:hypothetical protein
MKKLKPSPLLLIVVFVGIAMLALSPMGFFSEYSYKINISDETGEPILDSSGNIGYNLSEEQEIAKEFYDYQNEVVIQGYDIQITIFWIFMILLLVFAVFFALKPFLFPKRMKRR